MRASEDITELLERARGGDDDAFEELLPQIYQRLQSIARFYLREGRSATYATDDVLAEFNGKLLGQIRHVTFENARHFYAYAATVIQNLWATHWERKAAIKRGGKYKFVSLSELTEPPAWENINHYELKKAMAELKERRPDLHEVILHRFFLGTAVKDIAELMEVSPRTVLRHVNLGLIWLEENTLVALAADDGGAGR